MGINIKSFMNGMTPAELSRITGVPAMTIGRILRGETTPQIDTLERIAKGLNAPLPAIVCKDEVLRYIITKLSEKTQPELHAIISVLKL